MEGTPDGAVPVVTIHTHWMHVAVMDLLRIDFEGQALSTNGHNLAIAGDCREVNLEDLWTFLGSWSFVRDKDTRLSWYLRFFFLPHSMRPLGAVRPIQCTAAELEPWPAPACRAVLFGNGARVVERARKLEERQLLKEAVSAAQPRLRAGTRINGDI